MKPTWRDWVVRSPPAVPTALAVVFSVAASLGLLLVLMEVLRIPRGPLFAKYLLMTVLISALVSASVSAVIVRLLRDVGHARRALQQQAWRDELTGLDNRRRFAELARREIERSRRSRQPLVVALLDIDDFKRVNDMHGHGAGDALLVSVARAAEGALRSTDLAARWGGEEFAMLLLDTSAEAALPVLERVRSAVRAMPPIGSGASARHVTVSVGVATGQADECFEALIDRADRAMYLARQRGKDRVVIDTAG